MPGARGALLPALVHPRLLPRARRLAADPWRSDEPVTVGWAIAAALVARTALLRDLGPFATTAHLFFEDMDLCLRAAARGVPTELRPEVRLLHSGGHSTGPAFGGEPHDVIARRRRAVIGERLGSRGARPRRRRAGGHVRDADGRPRRDGARGRAAGRAADGAAQGAARMSRGPLKRGLLATPLGRPLLSLKRRFDAPEVRRDREDNELLLALLAEVLAPDSNCVEVGAHQGAILAEMVRLAPRGTHVAFEPLPHLAQDLHARFPGVEVHASALSDAAGEAEFVHVATRPGWSGFRERPYPADERVERITVPTERLDDVVSGPVALVKIDVEGAERQVLEGARTTLVRDRPVVVFEHGLGSADHYGTEPRPPVRDPRHRRGSRARRPRRRRALHARALRARLRRA